MRVVQFIGQDPITVVPADSIIVLREGDRLIDCTPQVAKIFTKEDLFAAMARAATRDGEAEGMIDPRFGLSLARHNRILNYVIEELCAK